MGDPPGSRSSSEPRSSPASWRASSRTWCTRPPPPARRRSRCRSLHGQATWPAGKRPAPPFTLRNVLGGSVSLASTRGHVTLIAFLDSRCKSLCPFIGRATRRRPALAARGYDARGAHRQRRPRRRRAGQRPSAAQRWRMGSNWRWLTGTRPQLAAVWRSYGIVVRPTTNDIVHGAAVYLIDRRGYERAGYLAPLLPELPRARHPPDRG